MQRSMVVLSLLLAACAVGGEDEALVGRTSLSSWFRAYQDCQAGDPDCNVCANSVKRQFDDAFDGEMRWDNASWSFNWERNYPPSYREPDNVFGEHVQGFSRTNRDPYRFVGSYSADDGSNGGVFFIHRDAAGHKALSQIHTVRHRHPSGVSVIGKYVAFSDASDKVRLIDMDRVNEAHLIEFTAKGMSRAGGGLGLAKLANGGYLLVVSPKGSSDGTDREVRFYRLTGSLVAPKVTAAGVWAYTQPAGWSGDYRYTENMSVIPECGTGDIYVVNIGGDDRLYGRGYYLLSKVVPKEDGTLALAPLRAYWMDQDQSDCHLRSAGSAWVAPTGDLQLFCHERKAVNGLFDGDADSMRFRQGTNYVQ